VVASGHARSLKGVAKRIQVSKTLTAKIIEATATRDRLTSARLDEANRRREFSSVTCD